MEGKQRPHIPHPPGSRIGWHLQQPETPPARVLPFPPQEVDEDGPVNQFLNPVSGHLLRVGVASCYLDKGTPVERLRTQSYGSSCTKKTAGLPKGTYPGAHSRVGCCVLRGKWLVQ